MNVPVITVREIELQLRARCESVVAVLAEARERRRGRPKGAKNKRTDDFARWLLAQGPHPAATMMRIQGTPTEVLMEASGKSYLECVDRQIRCAEALLPYLESKKPVAVDMTFTGVADLFIEGVTHNRAQDKPEVANAHKRISVDCMVRRLSGGPEMLVLAVDEASFGRAAFARCAWFDGSSLDGASIAVHLLTLMPKA